MDVNEVTDLVLNFQYKEKRLFPIFEASCFIHCFDGKAGLINFK